jgi:hypothetical protein
VDPVTLDHETTTEKEASLKMAHAKKKWIIDYQLEREKKMQYVQQHVAAQNLDVSALQGKIQTLKNSIIPSLDDITMVELQNIVDEMAHEANLDAEEDKEGDQIDSNQNNAENKEISDVTSA